MLVSLAIAFLCLVSSVCAQIEGGLKLEVVIDNPVTYNLTRNAGGKEKRTFLDILNKREEDSVIVVLLPGKGNVEAFSFAFGRGKAITLKRGLNEFAFDPSGLLPGYPGNMQRLSFPLRIRVQDRNNKNLLDKEVEFSNNKPQPDTGKTDTEKITTYKRLTRIPFYDAYLLSDYKNTGRTEVKEVLNYYLSEKNVTETSKLIERFSGNPFLNEFVEKAFSDRSWDTVHLSSSSLLDLSGVTPGALAGVEVTNVADGLAKFIVKRAREELTIAFFRRFKDMMKDNDYRDAAALFPETYKALNAIGNEIYQFNAYMQTLRECFEKDLRELPAHLPLITENHPEFYNMHRELKALLLSGSYIAEGFRFNEHPGKILENFPDQYLEDLDSNWRASVQTIQIISASFRDSARTNASGSYWVSSEEVKKLVANREVFKIFLGLIYEESKHPGGDSLAVRFSKGICLPGILKTAGKKGSFEKYYSSYKNYFTRLGTGTNKLASIMKDIKDTKSNPEALELYCNFLNESVNFMEAVSDIRDLLPDEDIMPGLNRKLISDLRDSIKVYFDLVRSSVQLVWDIKRRSYASALVNVVRIYSQIRPKLTDMESENIKQQLADLQKPQKSVEGGIRLAFKGTGLRDDIALNKPAIDKLRRELDNIKNDAERSEKVMNDILKYGTFAATIVQANNSDQVEEAIEAFTLPAGSSSIKRESAFNAALNAYAGFHIGYEHIRQLSETFNLNSMGLAAPIGVSFGWGHNLLGFSTEASWSTSLYLSLLDLGAIASFRVNDDTTKSIPAVQLKDILSPGLFLSLGIPSSPVSFNLGFQMGPNLHEVKATENKFRNEIYLRYSIGLCIDIPLLNLYTRPLH
ncbi:MAG: hypothetical protein HF314_07645 [Ignavibacteria bacterium]|jgi:hypothetical protein|nr:hypothetical protein [Ignavibacteria bacterium]MCU7502930.1 hypothetical protein [Ignavibacteria bacterium]MCU7515576.1 hypothetical protein [Ignavibacteria bacterium]